MTYDLDGRFLVVLRIYPVLLLLVLLDYLPSPRNTGPLSSYADLLSYVPSLFIGMLWNH